MTRLPLLGLLLLTAAPPAMAQRVLSLSPYLETLRTVRIEIGGDTLDFLLDTGGGITTISPAVAHDLGCVASGRITGFRMRGERVTVPTCAAVPLSIGGRRVVTDVGVFDLMTLIGPDRPPVHGMISLQTLGAFSITLDLRGGTLTLETPRSLRRRAAEGVALPVRLANGQSGEALDLFLAIPATGRRLWLLWDSGHIGPLYLAPHTLPLLGLDTSVSRETLLPLGTLPPANTRYAVRDIIYDGVLGEPLIAKYRWTIDLPRGLAWVRPNALSSP